MCRSFIVFIMLIAIPVMGFAGQTVVDPAASPYERHILYQALVLFWIGIAGLIVIILMKLKEAQRTQDMDLHKDDENAPFLD